MVIGIIEDDNLLRKALDTSMKNQGYTTILAGSRKEAIKNIDKVTEEYKDKYAEFYDRFCCIDDGHAAERVVKAVFGN